MWVSATRWVAASIDEVVGRGSPDAAVGWWFPLLATVDGHAPGDGLRAGATGHAELALPGGRDVPVRWRVVRRVRDTVHLEVADDAGGRLALRSSFSPWDGGTAVEFGIEGERIGGRRLRQRAVARALERAIATIDGRAPATSGRSARRPDALVPSVAGLPASR